MYVVTVHVLPSYSYAVRDAPIPNFTDTFKYHGRSAFVAENCFHNYKEEMKVILIKFIIFKYCTKFFPNKPIMHVNSGNSRLSIQGAITLRLHL